MNVVLAQIPTKSATATFRKYVGDFRTTRVRSKSRRRNAGAPGNPHRPRPTDVSEVVPFPCAHRRRAWSMPAVSGVNLVVHFASDVAELHGRQPSGNLDRS